MLKETIAKPLNPCWDVAVLRCVFLITFTFRKRQTASAVVTGIVNKTLYAMTDFENERKH